MKEFFVDCESKFDIGRPVDAIILFVLQEKVADFNGVSVLAEPVGAFQVEPQDLASQGVTCSTLHFISGTSSLRPFSLRQVRKLFSRKLHSVLGRVRGTFLARVASIAYPWFSTVIIKNIQSFNCC